MLEPPWAGGHRRRYAAEVDPIQDAVDEAEASEDVAYKWATRALYVTLLVGNIYVLYDMVKDQPEVVVARARVAKWWAGLKECDDCARRRATIQRLFNPEQWQLRLKISTNRMHWEAAQILDPSAAGGPVIEGRVVTDIVDNLRNAGGE